MGGLIAHGVVVVGVVGFAFSVATFGTASAEDLAVLAVGSLLLGVAIAARAPWQFKAITFISAVVLATAARIADELRRRRRRLREATP